MNTAIPKLQPPRRRGDFTNRLTATTAPSAMLPQMPMPVPTPATSLAVPASAAIIEAKPACAAQSASVRSQRGTSGISRPVAVASIAAYATVLALIAGGSLVQAPPVPLQPGSSSPAANPDFTAPDSSAQEADGHLSSLGSSRPTTRLFRRGGISPADTLATVCGTPDPSAVAEVDANSRDHAALVRDVTGKTIALILTRIASPVSIPVGSPTDTCGPAPAARAIPQHI